MEPPSWSNCQPTRRKPLPQSSRLFLTDSQRCRQLATGEKPEERRVRGTEDPPCPVSHSSTVCLTQGCPMKSSRRRQTAWDTSCQRILTSTGWLKARPVCEEHNQVPKSTVPDQHTREQLLSQALSTSCQVSEPTNHPLPPLLFSGKQATLLVQSFSSAPTQQVSKTPR